MLITMIGRSSPMVMADGHRVRWMYSSGIGCRSKVVAHSLSIWWNCGYCRGDTRMAVAR